MATDPKDPGAARGNGKAPADESAAALAGDIAVQKAKLNRTVTATNLQAEKILEELKKQEEEDRLKAEKKPSPPTPAKLPPRPFKKPIPR